ncbi:MAG: 3-dehydro-L-gulonate 2-dehydrogenase [Pleomorphochaeta sp.]
MRIPEKEMFEVFNKILLSRGYDKDRAKESATNFVNNSLDGMYSHGVNRFSRVIEYIDKGYIKVDNIEFVEQKLGALEIINGNLAMGNLVATHSMDRAIKLANENGIGAVAIKNTNHWMRGGAYGWQAANAGCASICWTNTIANMPAWGGLEAVIGNNPLVLSLPRENGKHVVVDMAMSQFSYGKIEQVSLEKGQLPVYGGYDSNGNLTKDPSEIEKTQRPIPVGYWKGSALSITLDLFASLIAGGLSAIKVKDQCESEYSICQIMIAIDTKKLQNQEVSNAMIEETINLIKNSQKIDETGEIRYPGEREYKTRIENKKLGIPVNDSIWNKILGL